MSDTSAAAVYFAPNGIGQFRIGVSPLGTRPTLNVVDTIASQYANSPSIDQLIWNKEAYYPSAMLLDNFYDDVWNVNTAQGWGLDVLGRIVGVTRVLEVSSTDYLGFIGPAGQSGVGFNQAPFYKSGEALTTNVALSDSAFRVLVQAKAMANVWDGSIKGLNAILRFLFGTSGPLPIKGNCYVVSGDRMMQFVFGSPLSPVQDSIINQSGVLPVPIGVVATVRVN